MITLFDSYAAGYSILVAVFFESVIISWIYGIDRFCNDIRDMLGFTPGIYWRVCWQYVAPIFLLVRTYIAPWRTDTFSMIAHIHPLQREWNDFSGLAYHNGPNR